MTHTVIGIFDSSADAQKAVSELKTLGINDDRIDISSASSSSSSDSSYGSGSSSSSSSSYSSSSNNNDDSIGGFFRSLFSDDDDNATTYSNVARHSDCLVTVHAQSTEEAQRAAAILDQYGSVDVDQRATEYGYRSSGSSAGYGTMGTNTFATGDTASDLAGSAGSTGTGYTGATGTGLTGSTSSGMMGSTGSDLTGSTDTNLTGSTGIRDNDNFENTSIPIIEENLQVGKREVETGGARLRSRIVERPVEEHLRLRSEHVRVERHATDRPATDADFTGFREGEIELTEHAEVPIVNKEARVVEEVSLGKEVEERDEVIRDTVRSTEVDVERTSGDNSTRNLDSDLDQDAFNRTSNTDPNRPLI